jgi:hypothetical protein
MINFKLNGYKGGGTLSSGICTSSSVLLGVISAASRSSAVNSAVMFSRGRNTCTHQEQSNSGVKP